MLTDLSKADEFVGFFYEQLEKEREIERKYRAYIMESKGLELLGIVEPLKYVEGIYYVSPFENSAFKTGHIHIGIIANSDSRRIRIHQKTMDKIKERLGIYCDFYSALEIFLGVDNAGEKRLGAILTRFSTNKAFCFGEKRSPGNFFIESFKSRFGLDMMIALYDDNEDSVGSTSDISIPEATRAYDCFGRRYLKKAKNEKKKMDHHDNIYF